MFGSAALAVAGAWSDQNLNVARHIGPASRHMRRIEQRRIAKELEADARVRFGSRAARMMRRELLALAAVLAALMFSGAVTKDARAATGSISGGAVTVTGTNQFNETIDIDCGNVLIPPQENVVTLNGAPLPNQPAPAAPVYTRCADVTSITVAGANGNDNIDLIGVNPLNNFSNPLLRGRISANGLAGIDTIAGGPLAETLTGAGSPDSITGNGGNDTISGGESNDTLRGGTSFDGETDNISGGEGNDSIFGGLQSADILAGDAGNDTIAGDTGGDAPRPNDNITGGAGADSLMGGVGQDTITGGTENDFVVGEAGDDNVSGEAGDDVVGGDSVGLFAAGGGRDTIAGGCGNDGIFAQDGAIDTVFSGAGNDGVAADANDVRVAESPTACTAAPATPRPTQPPQPNQPPPGGGTTTPAPAQPGTTNPGSTSPSSSSSRRARLRSGIISTRSARAALSSGRFRASFDITNPGQIRFSGYLRGGRARSAAQPSGMLSARTTTTTTRTGRQTFSIRLTNNGRRYLRRLLRERRTIRLTVSGAATSGRGQAQASRSLRR